MKIGEKGSRYGGFTFWLKGGIEEPLSFYTWQDFPDSPAETVDTNLLGNFYIWAVKLVDHLAVNGVASHLKHLSNDIERLATLKTDANARNYLEDLFVCFLKLFDTMPLVDAETREEEKQRLLLAKKHLSLALDGTSIQGARTRVWFERLRIVLLKRGRMVLS